MAYKTLLTVVTETNDDPNLMDAAVALARVGDAHLSVVCLGLDRTQANMMAMGGTGLMVMPDMMDNAREQAAELSEQVSERLRAEDIRWTVETDIAPVAALGTTTAQFARYADLMIASPPRGTHGSVEAEAAVEAALFAGHIPVLIVPREMALGLENLRVLIAWNDSDQALAAVRAAMPILSTAKSVTIAVIDPPAHAPDRSDPGGPLAQLLSRHGVHTNIVVLAKPADSTANALLRQARDSDSNLIVMGAYGHSRLRETLLGGATRDMLATTTIPVFLAH